MSLKNMFFKNISRALCASLALSSAAVFAEDIFRVDILHVVNDVEKPMSLYINEGQPGSISFRSTENLSSFEAIVQVNAMPEEDVFSIYATINVTDENGLPGTSEIKTEIKMPETPVVIGESSSLSSGPSGEKSEQLTITLTKIDPSALPDQASSR